MPVHVGIAQLTHYWHNYMHMSSGILKVYSFSLRISDTEKDSKKL